MSKITLTRDLAFAAGTDAGNKSMRKNGRTAWNESDFDAAQEVTNTLLRHIPYESGGLAGVV